MADYGKIKEEGFTAYTLASSAKPYRTGTSHAAAWLAGWTDAKAEELPTGQEDQPTESPFQWDLWDEMPNP